MSPHSKGSVWGGMFLIAGSCIGAGMLALPILTGLSGFFPSFFMMFIAWAFMTYTGLLLIEVNGWFSDRVNFITMVETSLGKWGKLVAWFSYLILFYSLLVAYTAASGSIFSAIFQSFFSLLLPPEIASLFFTLLFGFIIYLGTHTVDLFNRFLMIGLLLTYFGMIGVGLFRIDPNLLTYSAPHLALVSLPVLVVSFGFQNMIPSLTNYMQGDVKRVCKTIIGGSLLTFFVYLIWSLLVLGTVNAETIYESYQKGDDATLALKKALGSSVISHFAQGFAFFAIVTSFLAQGLTLTHFLADGLKIALKQRVVFLISLSLLPPLFFALYNPQIFFKALSFAGGFCAMILFGILPALMTWRGRYIQKHTSSYRAPGGKIALVITLIFASFVISLELFTG